MKTKVLTLGLIFLILIACEKGVENPFSNNPSIFDLPRICRFYSSATNTSGQIMRTLKWIVVRATKVEINNGIGEVALEGMKEIAPYEKVTYVLTATNNIGQTQETCTAGYADVVIISGPTKVKIQYGIKVHGEVKNIGSVPTLNTKLSIEVYNDSGEFSRSAETMINTINNYILEPQQQLPWHFSWTDIHKSTEFWIHEVSEIRYEITWEE